MRRLVRVKQVAELAVRGCLPAQVQRKVSSLWPGRCILETGEWPAHDRRQRGAASDNLPRSRDVASHAGAESSAFAGYLENIQNCMRSLRNRPGARVCRQSMARSAGKVAPPPRTLHWSSHYRLASDLRLPDDASYVRLTSTTARATHLDFLAATMTTVSPRHADHACHIL